MSETYDYAYYMNCCGKPYTRLNFGGFFAMIADRIVERLHPKTALDAGCAMGFLVEQMVKRGVDCFGIDISKYAISQVDPAMQLFCQVGSITDPFPRRYDLIICIEVLEHLTAAEGVQAVANLCRFTDTVLFSSTPYDKTQPTHQNCQPSTYWSDLFHANGFIFDAGIEASFITPWAMLFRKGKVG